MDVKATSPPEIPSAARNPLLNSGSVFRYFEAMFNTRTHLLSLIEGLKKDIRENPDPRPRELELLEDTLTRLDLGIGSAASFNQEVSPVQHQMFRQRVREGTKKERFRSMVNGLIEKQATGRVHRQDVIAKSSAENFFPDTSDLDRDVSKYLSMDGTFVPDGEGYWRRKPADGSNEIRSQEGTPAT